ncbi:hypothetical protein Tco_0274274 [Tanacetum coccineum]
MCILHLSNITTHISLSLSLVLGRSLDYMFLQKEAKEPNLSYCCGYSTKHKLLQGIHCFCLGSSYLHSIILEHAYVEKAGINWFTLDANLLREALEITPIDQAHSFVTPLSGDAIMDFVNELGYPQVIHFVLSMVVNHLYRPWRAIPSMINQCLIRKTSGHDRPIYLVL